jgi:hypothetical protein
MEFVRVTFGTTRSVRVDGAVRGQTNDIIRMQAGTHSFDLGTPKDYSPSRIMTQVTGTSLPSPMVITFTPMFAAAVTAAARSTRAGARKTTRKKQRPPMKGVKKKKKIAKKSKSATTKRHQKVR